MNGRGIILRGFTKSTCLWKHFAIEKMVGLGFTTLRSIGVVPNLGFAGHTLDRRNFLRRKLRWIDVELFLEPIGMMVSKKVTTHP